MASDFIFVISPLRDDAQGKSSDKNNLVKVRISKLTRSDSKGTQPISIDEKDEKKLSKAVQEELEKAGLLDTQGEHVKRANITSRFAYLPRSFVPSFVRSFTCLFVRSLVRSSVHLFVRSLVRIFVSLTLLVL